MFSSASEGGEIHNQVQGNHSTFGGVRHLGLNAINGGGLALPAFHPEFQSTFGTNDTVDKQLAELCLAAKKFGLQLPAKPLTSPLEIFRSQIEGLYASKAKGLHGRPLPMSLAVVADDMNVRVFGLPEMGLPVFLLKECVEEINHYSPGLGWWIRKLISDGHGMGVTTYDPLRISDCASYSHFCGADNDLEFAKLMLDGREVDDLDTEDDQAVLAWMREQHHIYPSSLDKELALTLDPGTCVPKNADSVLAAESLLQQQSLSTASRAVLTAAIEVNRLFDSARRRKLHWGQSTDDCFSIGALGFVLWSETDMAIDVISHFEQEAYGGECIEELFCIGARLSEPRSWKKFIQSIDMFFDIFVAFTNLLLPMEDSEGESNDD